MTPTSRVAATVLAANLIAGLPVYLISFMLAYLPSDANSDGPGLVNHVAFLALISIFAVSCGLLGGPAGTAGGWPAARGVKVGVLLSLAVNAAVVGVGSIVSATHKDQNSVSAAFTTATDILVTAGLVAAAFALAAGARRYAVQAQD